MKILWPWNCVKSLEENSLKVKHVGWRGLVEAIINICQI